MEITVEKKERGSTFGGDGTCGNCAYELKITVPAERMSIESGKRFQKLERTAQLPGFRAGKAPKHLLEVYYGAKVEQESIEQVITNAYNETIEKQGIKPYTLPKISQVEYTKGQPLSFIAIVEIEPNVEIKDYKKIKVTKKLVKITDKEVNDSLNSLHERSGELVVADEQRIENGHMAIIDFESFKENDSIPNAKREGFLIEVGKGDFLLPFEENLTGLERGEEKEFEILMPDDFGIDNLSGQRVRFNVKIKEIKKKILPTLDDEFAKDIGEFNNLGELKEALRADLIKAAEYETNKNMKNQILENLLLNASVAIPDSLIEREVNYLAFNMEQNLVRQDVSIKKQDVDNEKIRENLRPEAIMRLKRALILEEIANKEDITVQEDEYKDWVVRFYRTQPKKMQMYLQDKNKKVEFMGELRLEKALNFLLEHANKKEIE